MPTAPVSSGNGLVVAKNGSKWQAPEITMIPTP